MVDLIRILEYLINESKDDHLKEHLPNVQYMETYNLYELIRILLCQRYPTEPIPEPINSEITKFINFQQSCKIKTSINSIVDNFRKNDTVISLWKGDITTLTDVTAIVNAANTALLGCFQPNHKCIDNVIHTAAGPDLRQACFEIIKQQGHDEKVGNAKLTPGFNLDSKYVIHTIGPTIRDKVSNRQIDELRSCYLSSLQLLEDLVEEHKSIAFCCISTGLFAFPNEMASKIAIDAINTYFDDHPSSSIKHVIFNVFLDNDEEIYCRNLKQTFDSAVCKTTCTINPQIEKAKTTIADADYLIISAGAGLSASVGFDYTSKTLFESEYKPFLKYGIKTLYGTIGFPWPSKIEMWNFFLYHYNNTRKWPKTSIYGDLLRLVKNKNWFVMTSNADGFFVKNGFDPNKVLTPQGNYSKIQCSIKCTDESYKSIDGIAERYPITKADDIPRCERCGNEMTMFLRMGSPFNELIVKNERANYKKFLQEILNSGKKAVILELGVGLNTPSVLRWPNEDKVSKYPNIFTLIRVGKGPSSTIPMEIANESIVINGEISKAIEVLNID